MPQRRTNSNPANLMVNIFDGQRKPIATSAKILITIIDGCQQKWYRGYCKEPNIYFKNLPVFNNFGDNYTVIAWAKGYKQAGFTPVKMAQGVCQHIDLMLLPENGSFNFNQATWEALKDANQTLFNLLRSGIDSEEAAKDRYDTLREDHPEIVAAFLNITTAMSQIYLPDKTPLDYIKELVWGEMQEDRFFAYADQELISQIKQATDQGQWTPEFSSTVFHPGATRSFKQVQFGEANVQMSFHEGDMKRIDGISCVKVEPDIDYYRDPAAHTILEVIPNALTGQKTDPKTVYVLRWIAGRHAGVPEFNPPYTIV